MGLSVDRVPHPDVLRPGVMWTIRCPLANSLDEQRFEKPGTAGVPFS